MRDHVEAGAVEQRQTIGQRIAPQVARYVVRPIGAAVVEPVVFERQVHEHDLAELRRIAQERGVVGHVLQHVAQDHGIEAGEARAAKIAAMKLDLGEAGTRRRHVGRRNVEPDAQRSRHRRDQLAGGAADLEHAPQRRPGGQHVQQLRQLEQPHFEIDLRLLDRSAGAARDVLGVLVVERREVHRRFHAEGDSAYDSAATTRS
jgi:hypothetical protein